MKSTMIMKSAGFTSVYVPTELLDKVGIKADSTLECVLSSKIVWRCFNRLQNGIKYCKSSPTIEETVLHDTIVRVINKMLSSGDSVMPLIKKQLTCAIRGNDNSNIYSLEFRITELKKMMMELVDLASKSSADENRYDKEFERMSNEIVTLTEVLNL